MLKKVVVVSEDGGEYIYTAKDKDYLTVLDFSETPKIVLNLCRHKGKDLKVETIAVYRTYQYWQALEVAGDFDYKASGFEK